MTKVNLDDLIGLPYQITGRGNPGYDCYGYAIEVCHRFGKILPDIESAKKEGYNFTECMEEGLKISTLKEVEYPENEADVVFFKDMNGVMNHIGIYLGDGLVTHCNAYGVHTEKLSRKAHFIGRCFTWLQ